jgi:hypothetical protein
LRGECDDSVMTTQLATERTVQGANYGFMFSVRCKKAVDVHALWAASQRPGTVAVTIYSAIGHWDACKTNQTAWRVIGTGEFTGKDEPTRIVLDAPLSISSGLTRSFYLFSKVSHR